MTSKILHQGVREEETVYPCVKVTGKSDNYTVVLFLSEEEGIMLVGKETFCAKLGRVGRDWVSPKDEEWKTFHGTIEFHG